MSEIDPRFTLAYAGMGRALFEARRYAEALVALQQALDLQPESEPSATLYLFIRWIGSLFDHTWTR